jgi:hypothetical protein
LRSRSRRNVRSAVCRVSPLGKTAPWWQRGNEAGCACDSILIGHALQAHEQDHLPLLSVTLATRVRAQTSPRDAGISRGRHRFEHLGPRETPMPTECNRWPQDGRPRLGWPGLASDRGTSGRVTSLETTGALTVAKGGSRAGVAGLTAAASRWVLLGTFRRVLGFACGANDTACTTLNKPW